MPLYFGQDKVGSLYLGSTKIGSAYMGSTKVFAAAPALAPRSMRFDFKYDHFNPISGLIDRSADGLIWTHVSGDVYDFHYDNADWGYRTVPVGSSTTSGGLFNEYAYRSGSTTVWPMGQHKYDLLDMDLTGVTTASYLFNSARQVQHILSIRNTSSVTDFSYFVGHNNNTLAITSVPLFDTSSATNMSFMFKNCSALTSVPLFNTSNVTDSSGMFNGCSALTSAPLFNLENVTNSRGMFLSCTSLTSVPLYRLTSVTDTTNMFYGCTEVTSGAYSMYDYLSSKPVAVTTYAYTFTNCGSNTTTGAAELSQIPAAWGGLGA